MQQRVDLSIGQEKYRPREGEPPTIPSALLESTRDGSSLVGSALGASMSGPLAISVQQLRKKTKLKRNKKQKLKQLPKIDEEGIFQEPCSSLPRSKPRSTIRFNVSTRPTPLGVHRHGSRPISRFGAQLRAIDEEGIVQEPRKILPRSKPRSTIRFNVGTRPTPLGVYPHEPRPIARFGGQLFQWALMCSQS